MTERVESVVRSSLSFFFSHGIGLSYSWTVLQHLQRPRQPILDHDWSTESDRLAQVGRALQTVGHSGLFAASTETDETQLPHLARAIAAGAAIRPDPNPQGSQPVPAATQLGVMDLTSRMIQHGQQIVPAVILKPLVATGVDVQHHPGSVAGVVVGAS